MSSTGATEWTSLQAPSPRSVQAPSPRSVPLRVHPVRAAAQLTEAVEATDDNVLAARVEGRCGELLLPLLARVVEALQRLPLLVVEGDDLEGEGEGEGEG